MSTPVSVHVRRQAREGYLAMTKQQAIEYIMQKNNVNYVTAKVYVETVLGL